jgi:hypothetical protein
MLKSSYSRLAASLAFVLLAPSCAHQVDQRPNKPVGSDLAQTVVVTNETASPLTLLPPVPGSTKPAFIIHPGGQAPLGFTVRLEENVSPGREREVVLVPEKSSTYVTQSAADLLIMARFGTGPARQVRVGLGKCLFDPPQAGRAHQLLLKKPPLSGVPSLQLCP